MICTQASKQVLPVLHSKMLNYWPARMKWSIGAQNQQTSK
jgi:hypothetical protein